MNLSVKAPRITSIDILRGLVMLLMMVDHVREHFFFHVPVNDPMDINTTTPSLYFTRLSAHFCAPIFVFLAGLSAWLYADKNKDNPKAVTSFLIKRGLFIILLEITVVNFLWFGNYNTMYSQVMWAIGISMISLAFLCRLPRLWIGIIGFVIVAGHNLLSPVQFESNEWGYGLWTILHDRGFLISDGVMPVKISYPLLPWIGVILLGYFTGPLFSSSISSNLRQKRLIMIGFSSIIILLVIRGFSLYGETLPWIVQNSSTKTLMSFFNFTKYPPSLDFILLTIGIGMLLLSLFESVKNPYLDILKVFGSSPMFFYLLHLFILLIIYKMCVAVFGLNQVEYFGVDYVWQLWAIAIVLMVALYYPTKLFSEYKRKSTSKLIKYF